MPAPGSEYQVWPWRPWPASWRSARTMVPGSQVAAARCVESMESKCRIWRSWNALRRRSRSIIRVPRRATPPGPEGTPSRLRSEPRPLGSGPFLVGQAGSLQRVGNPLGAPVNGVPSGSRAACQPAPQLCTFARSSYQLQAEAQVHRAGGVRDGAGGDEIGAHVGVVADVFQGDAAGEFHLGAAGDFADPIGGLVRREVVPQEVLRAAFQCLVEFLAGAHFNLHGEPAVARALQSVAHAACRRDVIVLDQNGVVEAHAVVPHAPGRGGRLL